VTDLEHLDEHGQPCKTHAPTTLDKLLALATVGARMPSLHHDCASKLQGIVMALDEIAELADDPDAVRRATTTAHEAVRDLQKLLVQSRTLTKAPQRAKTALAELVRLGSERFGVRVRGELSAVSVDVVAQAAIHAFGALLDLVAGPSQLGRTVDVSLAIDGRELALALSGPRGATAKLPANASETIAIASFVIARDGGSLRCAADGERVVVRLPIAPD
jgi:hypothetical protein